MAKLSSKTSYEGGNMMTSGQGAGVNLTGPMDISGALAAYLQAAANKKKPAQAAGPSMAAQRRASKPMQRTQPQIRPGVYGSPRTSQRRSTPLIETENKGMLWQKPTVQLTPAGLENPSMIQQWANQQLGRWNINQNWQEGRDPSQGLADLQRTVAAQDAELRRRQG